MLTYPFKNKSAVTIGSCFLDDYFENLRQKEYARLDKTGHTYLDFTGGNLYAQSQLDAHHRLLEEHVLGNPHSANPTSLRATELTEEARQRVIDYFNAQDYYCIFTANASAALKIVGECYPFEKGCFLLLADNHNSVNGIREFCKSKGGEVSYAPIQYEDLRIDEAALEELLTTKGTTCTNKLFAFPAQSNVSGIKHELQWIAKAHQQGWDVMLDAAAFVPTSKLDLSVVKPDFVSVSFYKIFGYPTGLGCLLIRKDKFDTLRKPWFAGGTVNFVSVLGSRHVIAFAHERFEDGTINYLDIPAIKIGLDYIDSIGIERISERIRSLTSYLIDELQGIKHRSGEPVVRIFGSTDLAHKGGTLIMNFFNEKGEKYPFVQVEQLANQRKISLRTGCFCNPGVDEINSCISNEDMATYFSERPDFDKLKKSDHFNFLGKMRGAVRVSVGIATVKKDLDVFLDFVRSFRDK